VTEPIYAPTPKLHTSVDESALKMEAEEEEGLTKRQVRDRIPKRIKELQFGIL